MSYKTKTRCLVLVLILLATFSYTGNAQAWSGCGSTYTVQWGDSLSVIANRCGTTVNAILAANPGIYYYLYAGQVLVIPGGNYCNCPQDGYANTYVVQSGDTFSDIARRIGVSVNALWAANPHIWNINWIYPGQVIYVPYAPYVPYPPYPPPPPPPPPANPWFQIVDSTTGTELKPLSYGVVPSGTPTGKIKLINKSNTEVYVSFQGKTEDGFDTINEYPVEGSMTDRIPSAKYTYVAWVGGEKLTGQFTLGKSSEKTITFYLGRITIE